MGAKKKKKRLLLLSIQMKNTFTNLFPQMLICRVLTDHNVIVYLGRIINKTLWWRYRTERTATISLSTGSSLISQWDQL